MTKSGEELQQAIEKYVDDWHWDDNSRRYAFEMGKYLFSFMHYLNDQNLSERALRNHRDNIRLIGKFESGYGYNNEFFPEILADGPSYLSEFTRKVSDSKYAIQSYKSTWRRLDKYIKSEEHEKYLELIENKLKLNERGY